MNNLFISIEDRFVSTLDTSISDQGCDTNGKFTMVVHGWLGGINAYWVLKTISQLLIHRGGCVFLMDYSVFANVSKYFDLVPHFNGLSAVLTNKLTQIGNYDRQYLFCHSFGPRLCIDAGIKIGNQLIDRMDFCDPAGPGFDGFLQGFAGSNRVRDPKLAAKNVACINTSTFKGTTVYNCHQNYRMGDCKTQQIGSDSNMTHHRLCPIFYNLSFDYKFEPNNFHNCNSRRMADISVPGIRMGYLGDFDRSRVIGDIFIATAKYSPFIVVDGVIDNKP